MERPDIDQYFIGMAELVATRSTWDGTHVGCVLVRDKSVVSTGYNGTPRGFTNHIDRSMKKYYCHAEENAIVQAARLGHPVNGCVAYVTISPCLACTRMLINAGIKEVICRLKWDDPEADKAIELANICGVRMYVTHVRIV